MTITRFHSRHWFISVLITACVLLGGCKDEPKAVALSLVGYNYTGRYISDYRIDGYSGGDITETGSGVVCCLSFSPDSKIPFTVRVEWTLEDIRDFKNNKWTHGEPETHFDIVQVGPIVPNTIGMPHKPMVFETHFLPDGTVKAYVTEVDADPYYTPDGKSLRPMP